MSGMQVKVWLGTNADHYYILSRFLISRMLLVTKVLHTREPVSCLDTCIVGSRVVRNDKDFYAY